MEEKINSLIHIIDLMEKRIHALELDMGKMKRLHYPIPNMITPEILSPADIRSGVMNELKELFKIRGKAE